MQKEKAFTLIELIVVITIIAILSGVILFSVTQYINKSKDSNISANLAILIPAGEVYYNGTDNSYLNFCTSTVAQNAISQMPVNPDPNVGAGCVDGFCCKTDSINNQSWAACVKEFTNPDMAYCVDSRGVKKDIVNGDCLNINLWPSPLKCP